jgi:lysine biosynthesis protein LysW
MRGIVSLDKGEKIIECKQYLVNERCPSCQARVHFESSFIQGDIISCKKCDEILEVVSLSPFRLEKVFGDRTIDSGVSVRLKDPWRHWYRRR